MVLEMEWNKHNRNLIDTDLKLYILHLELFKYTGNIYWHNSEDNCLTVLSKTMSRKQ